MGRRTAIILASLAVVGLFGLTSALLIAADLTADSYAVNGASLDSEVRVDVDGNYYVSLAASDAAFSVAPGVGTQSSKIQVNLSVETNALGGAGLYLSMSGQSSALFLDGNTASTSKNIAAAATQTTYDNMASNTWGYSTDDVYFQGVPTVDSPTVLADVDGVTVGTSSEGVTSATIPVYYAAKVDTSIPSGSYANSVTYLAVVDGGIVTSAELTSITVDGNTVEQLQLDKTNTILVTTNLKTNTYGVPRVYYTTTNPEGYSECNNVVVSSNTDGYMTIQCETTPTAVATGLTLHIVPKGTPSSTNPSEMTGDPFCSDGTYQANTSQCEAGEWKWGSFTVALPNIKAPVFNGIKTMQEMTPEICADAQENDTTMLEDARDGKTYWVAKLADGNCWMTQNLNFDFNAQTLPLVPETSDVSRSWNPGSGAYTYNTASSGTGGDDSIHSWSLGMVVWKDPRNEDDAFYDIVADNLYNDAFSVHLQDVSSGWTPMMEYRTDGITYDEVNKTYDAHYLFGNYYTWEAATAGTGRSSSITGQTTMAPESICPAGWQLPLGGTTNNAFRNLLSQYGLTSSPTNGNYNITLAPLFFVRSGDIQQGQGIYMFNDDGMYWSSTLDTNSYGYAYADSLKVQSWKITTASSSGRDIGMSVRCVAPSA